MLSVARNPPHVVLNMQEFSFGGNLQVFSLWCCQKFNMDPKANYTIWLAEFPKTNIFFVGRIEIGRMIIR
jgi:hypothetical protein